MKTVRGEGNLGAATNRAFASIAKMYEYAGYRRLDIFTPSPTGDAQKPHGRSPVQGELASDSETQTKRWT